LRRFATVQKRRSHKYKIPLSKPQVF
jgi:hypothetical protein